VQRAAGMPVAEMALPVGRRPPDQDVTEVAPADDHSPRRTSNPLPLVERPWAGTLGAGAPGGGPGPHTGSRGPGGNEQRPGGAHTAATAALGGAVDGATVQDGRPGSTGWPAPTGPGPRSGDTGPGHRPGDP